MRRIVMLSVMGILAVGIAAAQAQKSGSCDRACLEKSIGEQVSRICDSHRRKFLSATERVTSCGAPHVIQPPRINDAEAARGSSPTHRRRGARPAPDRRPGQGRPIRYRNQVAALKRFMLVVREP